MWASPGTVHMILLCMPGMIVTVTLAWNVGGHNYYVRLL